MANKKVSFVLFLAAVIFQHLFDNMAYAEEEGLAFATLYEPQGNIEALIVQTLCVYLPIPFLLFLVYDGIQELREGYSRQIVIRDYNRTRLMIKKIAVVMGIVALGVALMTLISLLPDMKAPGLTFEQIIQIPITYYLVIVSLILVAYVAELFWGHRQIINIFVNIFFVVSLMLPVEKGNSLWNYICFPRLAFARVNGIISGAGISWGCLQICLCMVIILLSMICIKKYNKIDIY